MGPKDYAAVHIYLKLLEKHNAWGDEKLATWCAEQARALAQVLTSVPS